MPAIAPSFVVLAGEDAEHQDGEEAGRGEAEGERDYLGDEAGRRDAEVGGDDHRDGSRHAREQEFPA